MPERLRERASDVSTGSGRAHRDALPLELAFRLLSPGGKRARLTIVIFHRVLAEPDPLFPDVVHAAAFAERLRWLSRWFNVLPLPEAVAGLARGTLPARALSITFDDGYADNATVAMPILREHGLHATFFIAAAFLDGGAMWNDRIIEALRSARSPLDLSALGLGTHAFDTHEARRAAIDRILAALKYRPPAERDDLAREIASCAGAAPRRDLMMTGAQLRELAAAGMTVGGHTMTHPILAQLSEPAARKEIAEGREVLAGIVREPVTLFAYPNGKPDVDYRAAHVAMVKALGFEAAVSTAWGAARGDGMRYELPRFTPWDRTPLRFGARLMGNLLRASHAGAT